VRIYPRQFCHKQQRPNSTLQLFNFCKPRSVLRALAGSVSSVHLLSFFGLIRGAGAFTAVLPSFVLVSRMPFAQRIRDSGHFFRAASSSRREVMVGDSLVRTSVFRVGLGVGGAFITPGFRDVNHVRVMDGCVVWVRWAPPWYLG
jgi:hypothetical protein